MNKNLFSLAMLTIICLFCTGPVQAEMQWQRGRYAYVTNEGDNNLLVVDLQTEKVVKTLNTGKTPHALVFTRDGKGYVNNRGQRSLTVIDGNTFTVLHNIACPLHADRPFARWRDLGGGV
jgi:YVTN family beta-propeller protein